MTSAAGYLGHCPFTLKSTEPETALVLASGKESSVTVVQDGDDF